MLLDRERQDYRGINGEFEKIQAEAPVFVLSGPCSFRRTLIHPPASGALVSNRPPLIFGKD